MIRPTEEPSPLGGPDHCLSSNALSAPMLLRTQRRRYDSKVSVICYQLLHIDVLRSKFILSILQPFRLGGRSLPEPVSQFN